MIKIAFVLPYTALPVPAAKGGAIETLMTMLLEQNEKWGRFYFVFISPDFTDKVYRWKYSKSYTCSMDKSKFAVEIADTYGKSNKDVLDSYPYDYKACLITKYENVDYVIMEGAASRIHNCFENVVSRNRRAIHLHSEFARKGVYKEAFHIAVAPSRFVKNVWDRETPEEKTTYILPNGIRTERFLDRLSAAECCKLRNNLGLKKDDFVIIYCGRLIPEKGVKELLAAVLSIPDERVKLLLIGSDDFANGNKTLYAQSIVELAAKNKGKIIYLGYIDNQNLPAYYQCADMQAVPSLCEEAVGLVALEGMCSGLPLLVTRSGGMIEYVTEDTALIINKDEKVIDDLADGILWMIGHPTERKNMARLAVSRGKQFSSENYYSNFIKMMDWWEKIIIE